MAELIPEHYAVTERWRLPESPGKWEALIAEYLETIARRCHETGACIIGHIKALATFPGGNYLRVSVVSPTRPAGIEGGVPAGCTELVLTLNVIVYGLGHESLKQITTGAAAYLAHRWGRKVTIETV